MTPSSRVSYSLVGVCLLALLITHLAAVPSLAQQPFYPREMPPAARVVADIRGSNAMETRARQVAALSRLIRIMRDMAGERSARGGFPNAEEKPIFDAYLAEAGRIRAQGLATFPSGPVSLDSPRARWVASISSLELGPELYEELMERYFSPAFQAEHRAIMVARGELAAEGRNAINQGLRELNGVSDTTWDRMSPEAQEGAITFGLLMCGLLALGALRELLPFGLTSSDPPALRAGFARHRLASFTGIVTDYKVWDKSTSTLWERRTEGGHVSRYWTTDTYRHEEFDLVHEGERHHVHTSHVTFADVKTAEFEGEPGRMLTAVWATPRFRKTGRYIMFREPGSGPDVRVTLAGSNISRIIAPRGWTVLPAMGLGFVVGSSIDAVGSWMQVSSPTFRGFGVAIVAAAIWVGLYVLVSITRQGRFEAREVPRLREVVEEATKQ